ncbi:GMP synthase [Streptococcus pneumoniae]|nr:GMP synthase [Streptococcus pneumoniae]
MSNISTDLQDVEKIIVLDYGSQYNQLIHAVSVRLVFFQN